MCFFGSGHYEEQFCEIILNFVVPGQISFKDFSFFFFFFFFLALVAIFFGRPEPFDRRAILVGDIMGNIPVKLS